MIHFAAAGYGSADIESEIRGYAWNKTYRGGQPNTKQRLYFRSSSEREALLISVNDSFYLSPGHGFFLCFDYNGFAFISHL